ncbi:MAG: toll/interleukin-1 receptor domain-containing protein [Flavobacteriaceae bacterium]|nr:toll/interleukin-1 receptor domain-containing protein [Flavobacteriaceae bacterium]
MSAKKIFISYSRRDTDYVKSLVDALRKQGFEVWFDNNIRTGTDWDDTIESELKKADAIVLILSKTSVASDNVKDEISYAIGLDKPVSPIKIEECDVPMRLARKQFVDFTAMGHEAGFERLVNDLKISLKEAETSVPKGTFTPPKTITGPTNAVAKGSKKILPYILGGIVTLIIFVVLILNCEEGTTEDSEGNDAEAATEITNPDWEDAVSSNSIDNYLKYMYKKGSDDEYFWAASDSINALMPNEGVVTYAEPNGAKHFVKNLFKNADGVLEYGQDDNQLPRAEDILSAIDLVDIYDVNDKQIIHGENIIAGEKVRVTAVDFPEDGSVLVSIQYPDK